MSDRYHAFLNALMFYTRIRVPRSIRYSEELLDRATAFFPFVGWIVGSMCALSTWGALKWWGPLPAVLIGTAVGILTTGAFHEDGFADVCDGFGGGFTPERVLEIMKDSRLGTYGVIGLIVLLGTKVGLLVDIVTRPASAALFRWRQPLLVLPVAHALSRAVAATLIRTHTYVRANDAVGAKSKPMSKRLPTGRWIVVVVSGLVPLAALGVRWQLLWVVPAMAAVWLVMGRWFTRRIGGYTGDCLGAAQQVAEVAVYLVVAAGTR